MLPRADPSYDITEVGIPFFGEKKILIDGELYNKEILGIRIYLGYGLAYRVCTLTRHASTITVEYVYPSLVLRLLTW